MNKLVSALIATAGLIGFSTSAFAGTPTTTYSVYPVNLSFKVAYQDDIVKNKGKENEETVGTKIGSFTFNNKALVNVANGFEPDAKLTGEAKDFVKNQILAIAVENTNGGCPEIELITWNKDDNGDTINGEDVIDLGPVLVCEVPVVESIANFETSKTAFDIQPVGLTIMTDGEDFSLSLQLIASSKITFKVDDGDFEVQTITGNPMVGFGGGADSEDEFPLIVTGGSFNANLKTSIGTIEVPAEMPPP